ncbi:MAG: hypothetical protein IT462_17960 [Planctomycetes bacterium]|nr:hypothetical protein [Planctomycetota bacterium]
MAPNTRLDSMAARQRSGSTGTHKAAEGPPGQSNVRVRPGANAEEEKALPFQAAPGAEDAPMLGDNNADATDYMYRRKGTRRIPKPGGGVMGDRPALDRLSGSDRMPAVPPPPPPQPMAANLPPLASNVPPPRAPQLPSQKNAPPPPPPASRPNSLAGVRAEDLLGEEYRPMLEQMYKRQNQVAAERARTDEAPRPPGRPPSNQLPQPGYRPPSNQVPMSPGEGRTRIATNQFQQPPGARRPTAPIPPIPVVQTGSAPAIEPLPPLSAPPAPQQRQIRTPSGGWSSPPPASSGARIIPPRQPTPAELQPKAQDSSRLAFVNAERREVPRPPLPPAQDMLAPQGDFLQGPGRPAQQNVVQTPQPVKPPADDLGYDRPVDFGVSSDSAETVITTGRGPVGALPPKVITDSVTDQAPPPGSEHIVEEEDSVAGLDLREVAGEASEADGVESARDSAAHEEVEQRTGYLLWLQGVITVEEVEDSLTAPGEPEQTPEISALLSESGFADQRALYRFLARHETLAAVDLDLVKPTDKALALLRPAVARAYRVIPLSVIGKILLIAVSMPFEPKHLLEIRSLTGRKVKLFVAPSEAIDEALKKYYPGGPRGISGPHAAVAAEGAAAQGEKLEKSYDPTVSGEDSGLYAPQAGPAEDAQQQAGVQLEEAGQGEASIPLGMKTSTGMDVSDLDESTLGENNEAPPEGGENAEAPAEAGAEGESPAESESSSSEEDPYAEVADAAGAAGDAEMMKAAKSGDSELRLDGDSAKTAPPPTSSAEDDPFRE